MGQNGHLAPRAGEATYLPRENPLFVRQQLGRQAALLQLARLDKSNLPATLRTITEVDAQTLGVERVSVWRFDSNRTAIRCDDMFFLSQGKHEKGLILQARDYPSYFRALEDSYTIAAGDAWSDPRTWEFGSGYLAENGITSMMDAPIWDGGRLIGIVCHEHTGPPRSWTSEEQEFAGAVANMVSLTFETAERITAERARRLLELVNPVLRVVLDQMLAGFVLAEAPSGRVVLVNRAAERIWRRSHQGGISLFSPGEIRTPNGSPYDQDELPLARTLASGEPVLGEELCIRRGDGTWGHVSVNVAPVHGERGDLLAGVAIIEDLTERRRLEAEYETGKHRERFVSILGHDLRGPLAAAAMAAQLLLRTDGQCPGHAREAARIIDSCNRMERMIHDLLDFARASQGGGIPVRPRPTDLEALCRSIVEETRASAPNQPLELQVRGECRGSWDAERLSQVVANLLHNAVQHGAPGRPVTLRLNGEKDRVELEVHNEGPPIPAEQLPHLFEPFRRQQGEDQKARTLGHLGLGLFIAQEIVRAHAGTIEVRSTQEEGTTFAVILPR